jgi:hypothetical protein
MSRKLRLLFLTASCLAISVTAAAADTSTTAVRVKPRVGNPRTRFTVSFVAPASAGRLGSRVLQYEISVIGPRGRAGCVSSASASVDHVAASQRARVRLVPGSTRGRWCLGAFHGTVDELELVVCQVGKACPALAVSVQQIGAFRFRVRPRPQ